MAIETGFPCIPIKKVKGEGRGRVFEGDACLIFWPRGWVLIQGRAPIKALIISIDAQV